MELYVKEKDMPENCYECEYCMDYSDGCIQCQILIDDDSGSYNEDLDELKKLNNCPLKSLNQHDAEVKKEYEREKQRMLRNFEISYDKEMKVQKRHFDLIYQENQILIKELTDLKFNNKTERRQVVEELLEMLSHDLTLYTPHSFEYDNPDLRLYREREKITKDLQQKLNELKGE